MKRGKIEYNETYHEQITMCRQRDYVNLTYFSVQYENVYKNSKMGISFLLIKND